MKAFAALLALLLVLLTGVCYAWTLELPDSLTVVSVKAFYGSSALDRVIIPQGVTRIESKAFADSSLASVYIPDSVTYIAPDAFDGVQNYRVIAPEGSNAAAWCAGQGIEATAPDSSVQMTAAGGFEMPSGRYKEGSTFDFGGVLNSDRDISHVKLEIWQADRQVDEVKVRVSGNAINLQLLNEWRLQLLPVGEYWAAISVTTADGVEVKDWQTGSFSVVTRSSGVKENESFPAFFSFAANVERTELVEISAQAAKDAYDETGAKKLLADYGFNDIRANNFTDGYNVHRCGYTIGWRNMFDHEAVPQSAL